MRSKHLSEYLNLKPIGNIKVSFDFDDTLSRKDVQEYAKDLLVCGVDVYITTSRFEDNLKHLYAANPTNTDLWNVVYNLGIKRENVKFLNSYLEGDKEYKAKFIKHRDFLWHLDDLTDEVDAVRDWKCSCVGIKYGHSNSWKQKCNRLISNKLKQ